MCVQMYICIHIYTHAYIYFFMCMYIYFFFAMIFRAVARDMLCVTRMLGRIRVGVGLDQLILKHFIG